MTPAESALVVLVPEAEALVRPFRERHDPGSAAGVPAHVTVLYPFRPPEAIDAAVIDGLRRCMAGFAPFRFALAATRRFPGVLYLAPEPTEPFRDLTRAVWRRHPETPPYGGRYPDIVPHLCVAQIADEPAFDRVADAFARASAGRLPIAAAATAVALLDTSAGRWAVRTTLPLGR